MTHRPFSLFFRQTLIFSRVNAAPIPAHTRNPTSQPTRRLPFTNGIEGDNSREVKENDRIRKSLKTNGRKCLNCSQERPKISKPRKQNRQVRLAADPDCASKICPRIYCALLNIPE